MPKNSFKIPQILNKKCRLSSIDYIQETKKWLQPEKSILLFLHPFWGLYNIIIKNDLKFTKKKTLHMYIFKSGFYRTKKKRNKKYL